MLRQLLIVAALAGVLVSAANAAVSTRGGAKQVAQTTQLLMPGVTYTREVDFTPRGPVVLDVVTAPRPDGSLYTLAPVLSNEAVVATEKLTDLEKRLDATATVVGVNGDYFAPATGSPSGMLMRGGALDVAPADGRSSLGIAADGTLSVAQVGFTGTWQGSGQRRSLALNAPPAKGVTTLYTSAWGPTTPPESGVVEDVFSSFPATRPNQPLDAPVTQVLTAGPTAIPPGGAVLVARGAQVPFLTNEAPAGQRVDVRLTLAPDWSGMTSALGGGPLLVSGGKPVFNAHEYFDATLLNSRDARSAVGQLADGRILLVTVEGTRASYSVGMTNYELGVALARLGAVTAVGLGTGAPAAMAFDGTLLTRPSSGAEQPISDALVLSYSGVYAAPPSTDVLSPNGDGVDDAQTLAYTLVRPSKVSATLTGPGGAAIQLAADDEQPGTHTLQWDGKTAAGAVAPEGSWRFAVTATDDLGRTTTATRDFTLDDSLGALAVARSGSGAAVATFQLTRPASVVVTVQRRNEIVVATPFRGKLAAGAHSIAWSGRTASGSRAPNGDYQLSVAATTSVGRVELVAPFTVPVRSRRS